MTKAITQSKNRTPRRFARMPNNEMEAREPSPPPAPSTASVVKNGEIISQPADHTKPPSKIAGILTLLQRDQGATLEDLTAATGWLPHTARAAMTGLRKKGHVITSDKADGARRYRVLVTVS